MLLVLLTVRVSAKVKKKILGICRHENKTKSMIVRELLEREITGWRKQYALNALNEGKVTFAKAAQVARLSLWEFADLVKQSKTEWVRFTPEDILNEGAEASKLE